MTEFSLDRVVEWIRAEGFFAYVEQTGGGIATIFALPVAEHEGRIDYETDTRLVAAGPGWFDPSWLTPGATAHADVDDFNIGPYADVPRELIYSATPDDDEVTLTAEIVRRLRLLVQPPTCSHDEAGPGTWDLAAIANQAGDDIRRVTTVCDRHLVERLEEWYQDAEVLVPDRANYVWVRPFSPHLRDVD